MADNFVERIIIDLKDDNNLVFKVALDKKLPLQLNDLFKFNDFYQKYLEVTLFNSLDSPNVIINDLVYHVGPKQISQTMKKFGWDKTKFDLKIIKEYDYLVYNTLAILYGHLFGQNNGNGMIMIIPTNHYEYYEDKIFFEVRGLDGSISSMNIVEFMQLVSTFTSEPYTDPDDSYKAQYKFESRYTYFVITKYDTYTVIQSYVGTE